MNNLIICALISMGAVFAQQAAAPPARPAAAKPAARPAKADSGVDTVIELVKGGMSEGMIIKTLKTSGKAYTLAPADMLKLQKAGVSENIISVMMDPKAEVAAAAPVAAPAPRSAAPEPVATVAPVSVAQAPQKRRLAVTPFDYSAVRTWVNYWFQTDYNLGQGIRAMLTTRVAKLGTIRLVEREKIDKVMKEQDFGASGRVAQGSKAPIGKILGADVIMYGDIVTFGRDDTKKKDNFGGIVGGILGNRLPAAAALGKFKKEEKAVVVINYRLVDAETGEIVDTGEARGESKRESKDWSVFVAKSGGGAAGASSGMESSNFQETIIGEATMDACDKLTVQIAEKIPKLPVKTRVIDAMVASMQGNTLYINTGANEGVLVGDKFEIHKVTDVIKDPGTQEVLDLQTVKVGDLVVTQVRDKISIGTYAGPPLSHAQLNDKNKGYAARKVN